MSMILLSGMLLCSSSITSSNICTAATSTGVTLKDVSGEYLINKGVASGIKLSSSKVKFYKDLKKKDSYSTYLKKLSCDLNNYCYKQNIKSIELLFLDYDISYSKDLWKEPNVFINSSTVMGATCSIDYNWKGVVYTRIIDKNNKVTINKTNGVVIDVSKPEIIGVTNGSTYTSADISFKDNLSGIKKITISKTDEDGTKVITEVKKESFAKSLIVDQVGTYTITVNDNSGNQSTCTFKIISK